jgi:hypothetical protein
MQLIRFDIFYKLFILFIILLLIEGFFHHYYFVLSLSIEFLPISDQTGYNSVIWAENGLVELLQILFLLISIFLLIKFLKIVSKKLHIYLRVIIFFYLIGVTYYFFEEISWGQHIFGWGTPEFFSKINHQNEINLHNTSSIFNELPRNLLMIWCSLSFIFIKTVSFKYKKLRFLILPFLKLRFISILILIFFVPDFIIDKFDLAPGHPAKNDHEIFLNMLFEMISFNFVRFSELLELLFNYYVMSHSYYLVKFNSNLK